MWSETRPGSGPRFHLERIHCAEKLAHLVVRQRDRKVHRIQAVVGRAPVL